MPPSMKRSVASELGEEVNLNSLNGAKWPKQIVPEVENSLYQLRQEYRAHLMLAGEWGNAFGKGHQCCMGHKPVYRVNFPWIHRI